MEDDADEAARLELLRTTKRRVLHELDMQAAELGPLTPPHVHLERKRLRDELGIVEKVIMSPIGANFSDELGERSRFVGYVAEIRTVQQAVERLEARFVQFVEASMQWRRWGTWAFIILIVIVVIMALIGMFWLGRLSDARALVSVLWR